MLIYQGLLPGSQKVSGKYHFGFVDVSMQEINPDVAFRDLPSETQSEKCKPGAGFRCRTFLGFQKCLGWLEWTTQLGGAVD